MKDLQLAQSKNTKTLDFLIKTLVKGKVYLDDIQESNWVTTRTVF